MGERKKKTPETMLHYEVRRGPHALKGLCPTCERDPCCFAFFNIPPGVRMVDVIEWVWRLKE